jgi:hypothetical protein
MCWGQRDPDPVFFFKESFKLAKDRTRGVAQFNAVIDIIKHNPFQELRILLEDQDQAQKPVGCARIEIRSPA